MQETLQKNSSCAILNPRIPHWQWKGIYVILMDSKVTRICCFREAEFSPIQLTEEVSEILKSGSAAHRITPIFQKLKCSALEDLVSAFSRENTSIVFVLTWQFFKVVSNRSAC